MVKPQPPQDVTDSWPSPNFVDPEIRSHATFLGITLAFTSVTIIIVSLRTWVRFVALRAPGWDDYFIFVATLGAIAMCISVNVAMQYGWDRHYWDQKPEWFETSELMQWIIQVIFIVLMSCVKISALCTYLRASQGTRYRRFVWGTMVVVALWGIAFFFATVFECTPVHLYWISKDGKGCTNEDARLLIATVINILTDIIVVLMPIPIIVNLQLPKRERLTLGFLMCLGGVATVASIVRTVVMSQSLTGLRYDMTWNSFIVWIWLIVECNLAIICISVPVLRILVRRFLPRWAGKSVGSATTNKGLPTHISPHPIHLKQDPSMSSILQDNKPMRNANGIEMYPRPMRSGSFSSTGNPGHTGTSGPNSPIIGYDRYGQPIMRDEQQKYEQSTIARAV